MSETRYFLRTQGRVSGPFTATQIRALHQRGHFGRFHEVSVDQRTWQQAAELPELFPVLNPPIPPGLVPPAHPPSSPTASEHESNTLPKSTEDRIPTRAVAESPAIPPHWQAVDWYYQGLSGEPEGPLSLAQLHDLRRKGVVADTTLVCKPGMDSWTELATALRGPMGNPRTTSAPSAREIEAAERREHLGFQLALGGGGASAFSVVPLFVGLLIHGTSVAGSALLGLVGVLLFAALAADSAAYLCGAIGPRSGSGRQLVLSALILAFCELILRVGTMAFLGFSAAMAAYGPGGGIAGLMLAALASAASWGRTLVFQLYLCQAAQRRGRPLIVRSLLQGLPILGGVVIIGLLFLLAALISTAADLGGRDRTALDVAWMSGLFLVGVAWAWWFAIYLVALYRLQVAQ